ncbi:MAG: permease prefix domain 1-containing protein [Acidipropionibacterium sp.]|nr:permease prefix domain 1-containing protein [Acidipropionibacterium sp.]
MPAPRTDPRAADLAGSLAQWRRLMAERPGMSPDDVDELSDHLESEIADLQALGLAPDEAFLIAVKRIGAQDEVSREYARVHSERLWRQLVLTDADAGSSPDPSSGRAVSTPGTAARRPDAASSGLALALILGLAAGLAVRLPHAILGDAAGTAFYPHNLGFLVLPLIGYFLVRHWRAAPDDARGIDRIGGAAGVTLLVAVFAATAILVNIFPTHPSGQTFWLTAIHLPIALVVATGVAYLGPRWRLLGAWMDWVRFLGESVLYYILIALGGGALSALVMAIFRAIGVSPTAVEHVLGWVIPVGAGAAVLVCAWLVERKKSVIENMAPVLTAVFTPLMTAALLAFLAVLAVTGSPVTVDRNVLIIFDAVLIAVAAIVLFTVSGPQPAAGRPGPGLDAVRPHPGSDRGRPRDALGDGRAAGRVGRLPQQARRPRMQHPAAGPPVRIGLVLRTDLPGPDAERRRLLSRAAALAVRDPAALRGVGAGRGHRLPAPFRLVLTRS